MFPDKEIRCHETAFEKTCLECVTQFRCRKWVNFIGKHPQTGEDINRWDCRDHLEHLFWIEAARVQQKTTATIDALREEVQKANDVGMASALMGINAQMQKIAQHEGLAQIGHVDAPKQLTGSH